jgi:hypothetical protein
LEIKKLKAELSRVTASKLEMDYLIEGKLEEIQRLKEAMAKQEAHEKTLEIKLKELMDK